MNIIKKNWTNTEPCGTPLITLATDEKSLRSGLGFYNNFMAPINKLNALQKYLLFLKCDVEFLHYKYTFNNLIN